MAPDNSDMGAMDVDDDMDIIDLGLDLQYEPPTEAMHIEEQEAQQQIPEAYQQSDADLAADKVHIRGLDNLTTDDIQTFAAQYFSPSPTHIEWIDDSSANIVYSSTTDANAALKAFTDPALPSIPSDALQLRPANKLSTHPTTNLEVRLALLTDKKKSRAREASRFYLLNPDKAPPEYRRNDSRRGAGRERRSDYAARRKRPRDEVEEEGEIASTPFDENMYDDDPASLAARVNRSLPAAERRRRRSSPMSAGEDRDRDGYRPKRTRREPGAGGDLFPNRGPVKEKIDSTYGRLRDRSASPLRDGDGRHGFAETEKRPERRIRTRSATPPPRKRENGRANAGKELFGQSSTSSSSGKADNARELFPTKHHHRRTDAFDAADAKGKDLFSRIRGPTLADRITDRSGAGDGKIHGFNIRGSGVQEQSNGFSIRGLGIEHARVKELFPDKFGSAAGGKDLFESKLKNGLGKRKAAEDLFS